MHWRLYRWVLNEHMWCYFSCSCLCERVPKISRLPFILNDWVGVPPLDAKWMKGAFAWETQLQCSRLVTLVINCHKIGDKHQLVLLIGKYTHQCNPRYHVTWHWGVHETGSKHLQYESVQANHFQYENVQAKHFLCENLGENLGETIATCKCSGETFAIWKCSGRQVHSKPCYHKTMTKISVTCRPFED